MGDEVRFAGRFGTAGAEPRLVGPVDGKRGISVTKRGISVTKRGI